MQSPQVRHGLQVLGTLLVILFFGLALYSQLPQILKYNWVLDPAYLGLGVLLLILRGPVVVYGWYSTLRVLGHPLPFLKCIRIGYHSALARYLPGQMWYAVSRVYLAEKEGVPRVITAVSIFVETAMLVVGAALVTAIGVTIQLVLPVNAGGLSSTLDLLLGRNSAVWLATVGVLLTLLLIAVVLQPRLIFTALNWALSKLGRQPVDVQLSRRNMLRLLWPFALNWVHYGVMSFVLTAALYPTLDWSHLPAVIGLFTAAWLVGFLTVIVPQGFVVREGLVFTFLTTLIGVPAPVATAAAVLSRGWTMLSEALWALISTRFK